jgi:HTH-type transcriptional regulator/antitoxin HigA
MLTVDLREWFMDIKKIETTDEHQVALARILQILDAKPGTPESEECDSLVALVHAFEEVHFQIAPPSSEEALAFRNEQAKAK